MSPVETPAEQGVKEREAIIDYLRELATASRNAFAEYARRGEDDEVLDRWVARMEDYTFIADQIARGVHVAPVRGEQP